MGTSAYNEALAQTMQNSKMLFIVACGNGGIAGKGYDTDIYPVYPASFPFDNVISVANLLFDGSLSRDSDVKNILLNSSRKMDQLSGKMVSGGMLDAYAALSYQ